MVPPDVLLDISLYEDPLCPWCYVAQSRLAPLQLELGAAAVWRSRPFPLWLRGSPLSPQAREEAVSEVRRARKEREGRELSPGLWESTPFASSLPALMALEAARLQGESRMQSMRNALQRAALIQGNDVSSEEALTQLATQEGLHLDRFVAAYRSDQLRQLILETQQLAQRRGVNSAPTLVINGLWMIRGVREVSEYQELIFDCLRRVGEARRKSAPLSLH